MSFAAMHNWPRSHEQTRIEYFPRFASDRVIKRDFREMGRYGSRYKDDAVFF